jgi:hypothetical protein
MPQESEHRHMTVRRRHTAPGITIYYARLDFDGRNKPISISCLSPKCRYIMLHMYLDIAIWRTICTEAIRTRKISSVWPTDARRCKAAKSERPTGAIVVQTP